MAFLIQMTTFPGPFCEAAGITVKSLLKDHGSLPRFGKEKLLKGIIVELNDFCKEKKMSWDTFYQWVAKLCYDISMLPSISALRVTLGRLDNKRRSLRRNKQHTMLYDLMSEPFFGEKSTIQSKQQVIKMTPGLDPAGVVLIQVNQCLAKEL